MNFSDETVERLVGAVQKGRYMASCDIVSGNVAATTKEIDSRIVATILSSLTLADLMQVDEVRELVEASGKVIKRSSDATDANYNQPMMLVYEQDLDALMAAHDKFTEAK